MEYDGDVERLVKAKETVTAIDELVNRASVLTEQGQRRLLGLTGPPGAGKSWLGDLLTESLLGVAMVVPMDGFHLAQRELIRLGRERRKGALDTFDGYGFLNLLRRLRANEEPVIYAPIYRRDIEEPVSAAIPILRSIPLVVVEGNYLLVEQQPWGEVRSLLDEVWFLSPFDDVRIEDLIHRHVKSGKDRDSARAWAFGPDQANAELTEATKDHADVIVRLMR